MNRLFYIAFAVSTFAIGNLSELPSVDCRNLLLILGITSFLLSISSFFRITQTVRSFLLVVMFVFLGAAYAIYFGERLLANRLDEALYKKEIVVEGEIIDLPRRMDNHISFQFAVRKAYDPVYGTGQPLKVPQVIQLSQYPLRAVGPMSVLPNQQWRLLVKLKPIRGLVNFDIQDTDISSLRRSLGARGQVENNGFSAGINKLQEEAPRWAIDYIRFELQQWIFQSASLSSAPLLAALAVGDTSQLSSEQWNDYLKTGTNHLIAISGLHVGFFALVGYAIGLLIGRIAQLVYWPIPAQIWAHIIAFVLTYFYCLLAGFNIPTVRTLIMLGVVQWSFITLRNTQMVDSLFLALFLVCLYDPLAAYDRGFWLSFIAVGVLMFSFSGRYRKVQKQQQQLSVTRFARADFYLKPLIIFCKVQWVMFIGLSIPLLILVHNMSLSAPIANLVATPAITFLVVPSLLLSLFFHQLSIVFDSSILEFFATSLILLSDYGAQKIQSYLHACVVYAGDWNSINFELNAWVLPCVFLGVLFVVLPKGLRNLWCGIPLIILGLVFSIQPKSPMEILTFDVGQGTAVLIKTKNHHLLYDTGPAFSETSTAGSRIILPYLQTEAIGSLDKVIISHDDLDHSGGFEALATSLKIKELIVGQPEMWKAFAETLSPSVQAYSPVSCHYYPAWEWAGVKFSFVDINPETQLTLKLKKDNNRSCILKIAFQGKTLLLPGDIEKELEAVLLQQQLLEPVTLVLAPHHGSHSSSSDGFVKALQSEWVIYSAAFMSQHGHPHQDIQARYLAAGTKALNTATAGAIRVKVNGQGNLLLETARDLQKHYWYW